MNNSIAEIKNTLEEINRRLSDLQERISGLDNGNHQIRTAERKPNL